MSRPLLQRHIAGDRRPFDVGGFQYFLQAIDLLGALLDQRFAIPGQITQVTDRCGRNEAGFEEAMPQQIGQPFGILDIGLAPWNRTTRAAH
jgi:hypothetical protein